MVRSSVSHVVRLVLPFALLIAMIAVGCADATSDPIESEGQFSLDVTDTETTGEMATEAGVSTFHSQEVDEGVFEVSVVVNDMVLDALIDHKNGVSSLDGFASENGDDTQILDEDRAALAELNQMLNTELSEQPPKNAKLLRRAVSQWSQQPTTVDATRLVMGEEGRGYTMLCDYAKCSKDSWTGACDYWNWYEVASHDGNDGDWWDSQTSQRAQIGDHYSCSDDQWYWTSNGWKCGEPDHWNKPYTVGNCWGRCGGGCGGDTQYTLDATHHDGCVRNGHWTTSLWCDDEFMSASDDELFAPDCY
ncbi:MAG: hypothetical protein ACQEVA_02745 [Myxococcota bacterium]